MFGPAPVLDFDGTLVRLQVDWDSIRGTLGIRTIEDLWLRDLASWDLVAAAEAEAATTSPPLLPVLRLLGATRGFSVLTANSAHAVRLFTSRFPSSTNCCSRWSGESIWPLRNGTSPVLPGASVSA